MNELDTRTLLSRLASEPAPPTTVNVDRAIVTAQQHRKRGRWLLAAAAAAVVLVVTLGLVTAFRPDPPRPVPVVSAPTSFDPLRPRLEVGWLPDGVAEGLRNTLATAESVDAESADQKTSVSVYVVPRNGEYSDVLDERVGEPTTGPDINGKPSQWWTIAEREDEPGGKPKDRKPIAGGILLRWEWAPGASAQVRVVTTTADPLDTAAEVARSVRLDRPKPFVAPLRLDPPQQLRAARTYRTAQPARGEMPAQRVTGIEFGTSFAADRPSILVTLGQRDPRYVQPPNTTVGPHQAHEQLIDSTTLLMLPLGTGQELMVQCSAADESPEAKSANRAECRRVAASAEPVGTLDDPSTWEPPLR
ncbi:hypothetical protein [Cryptosporangium aurantiacum]|uniref:Uncharacterized protein n=1 Tax=Cryptosporangium aurantiacum TaxID=134849 RepID=A0A1M7RL53_9ACTN|nr:hypothetical protein [Cryptosporangium aurantiacum]SHN47037.1 hypothetical protein SAMN05443668_119133 [Cryptosporangium aurantiacum]